MYERIGRVMTLTLLKILAALLGFEPPPTWARNPNNGVLPGRPRPNFKVVNTQTAVKVTSCD